MLEIGEIIGLLCTKVIDDTKNVELVTKLKNDPSYELRTPISDVQYDNGIVIISNAFKNNIDMAVKDLIYTLFSYQSTKIVEFVIYDDDGKSDNKIISAKLSKFADINVCEHNDSVEIIILVDRIIYY